MKYVSFALCLALFGLSGCNIDLIPEEGRAFNYDFNAGAQGWTAGFSDYPADNAASYQLQSGIKALPQNSGKSGFFVSGMNRSDDLFMFLKRQFSGLEPSTKYYARVRLSFLSNAGVSCMGVGGAPGESVYLKFGYGDKEPKQEGYYLNLDKGRHTTTGLEMFPLSFGGSVVDTPGINEVGGGGPRPDGSRSGAEVGPDPVLHRFRRGLGVDRT